MRSNPATLPSTLGIAPIGPKLSLSKPVFSFNNKAKSRRRFDVYFCKTTASEDEAVVSVTETVTGYENDEEVVDINPPGATPENEHRISRYLVHKSCSHNITEGTRPLSEYMTLPVSQYSVLDADKVERLDEDTFRVQTSRVKFFGVEMTPIMTLTVKPHSTGCEITMLDCTLEGSKVVSDANQRFACAMRNYVSYEADEELGQLKMKADCVVKVAGIVPRWISTVFPIGVVNRLGRGMLSKILDIAMPRFLVQLEKDYLTWASGDDSRQAMSTGESFGLVDEVVSSGDELD